MRMFAKFVVALGAFSLWASQAWAIPSFAGQTGQPCTACHVGGFGPQLTPFGRLFKLNGYTMRGSDDFNLPVSAMAIISYLHTATDQAPTPPFGANNNSALDQASLFVAGHVTNFIGGFSQWTYDGIGRSASWDNLDLRTVDQESVAGSDVIVGLSLNNSPGVQDPWNTLPAWGFPFTSSGLAPSPGASTLLDGGLAQTVLGLSAYALWDSSIYTEIGLYWTPGQAFLSTMGVSTSETIKGAAPYIRLAYQKDYGDRNFEIGAFGLFSQIHPAGVITAGTADGYSDIGLDGSLQLLGAADNAYTLDARYTHETQNLNASKFLGVSAFAQNHLDDVRITASWYWRNMIGGTMGAFDTTGSNDPLIYSGNRTFTPDSAGYVLQADVTPFGGQDSPLGGHLNVRLGLQYTGYIRFDGAGRNFDGAGHNASGNNALRVFAWFAF